jgi:osmotically-inducible protein OsmY
VKGTGIRIGGSLLLTAALLATGACNREDAASPERATVPGTAPETARTDAELTTDVQARYYTDDIVRGRDVSVVASDGVVTLRGRVESEAARDRAVTLAREVQGVKDVRNELRVEAPPSAQGGPAASPAQPEGATGTTGTAEPIGAAWITTKIQAQYFTSDEVKPWNVDVTTSSDGVVTLEGEVEGAADRDEAVRIARETEGVTRVEDRLRVKTPPNDAEPSASDASPAARPDPWLTAKIQSKYFLDDKVKMSNIDVDTRDGVVTLRGSVATEAERRQALALARNTEGVRNVTDELKVDPALRDADRAGANPGDGVDAVPPLKRPDAWITMKVQSQFFLDPEVKGHQIDVDTQNGVVVLKGTVSEATYREQAERIARETEGVTRVENRLRVGTR